MLKTFALTALSLLLAVPAMAQQPPAVQPTTTAKAVEAAGGLAKKVLGTTPVAAPAKAPLLNINRATAAELDALPKIGAARTKAIVAGRPYKSVQDLLDRKILPKDAFEAVKDRVAVK